MRGGSGSWVRLKDGRWVDDCAGVVSTSKSYPPGVKPPPYQPPDMFIGRALPSPYETLNDLWGFEGPESNG